MSITVYSRESELPPGCYLADCAVSGGTLRDYLQKAQEAAGGRLCIRIAPVYMDFSLPCPSGVGRPLTVAELQALHQGSPCYFSQALCTEYFTFLREGQAHVVLFDSLTSLRAKYKAVEAAGISMVLIEDPALQAQLCS